jgi:hypothetical protein
MAPFGLLVVSLPLPNLTDLHQLATLGQRMLRNGDDANPRWHEMQQQEKQRCQEPNPAFSVELVPDTIMRCALTKSNPYVFCPLALFSSHRFSDVWLSAEGLPKIRLSALMSSSRRGQCIPRLPPVSRQSVRSSGFP